MAKYADKHHQDVYLNVGDLVYVSIAHFLLACYLFCKLTPPWFGPFPSSHSVAFHVQLPGKYGCVHPVFHVSYLQPYLGPASPLPPAPLPLDDMASVEYKVKGILNSYIGYFKLSVL